MKDRSPCGRSSARGSVEQTVPCSDSLDDIAKCLAGFEEGYLLLWHFDSRSSFWIPSDARSSLARMEASESADFHLVARSQSADDTVKYGANDDVGFLLWQLNGLTNFFSQISPSHLAHPRCITKKSNTASLGSLDASCGAVKVNVPRPAPCDSHACGQLRHVPSPGAGFLVSASRRRSGGISTLGELHSHHPDRLTAARRSNRINR